jgi:hypothetical protein
LVKNYKESKENHLPTFVKPVVSEHRARALLFLAPKARSYLLRVTRPYLETTFPTLPSLYKASKMSTTSPQKKTLTTIFP